VALHTAHPIQPPVQERHDRGRAARTVAPRSGQGVWAPDDTRPDPLTALLAQNEIRAPELLPIRHGRMSASPWTYLRGAAVVMANDLATTPNSGLTVQLCGDAHVLNFGLWATPERSLSFDLRDFDETHRGPFEWDVKRLVASLVVCARENDLGDDVGKEAVHQAVGAYQAQMRAYRNMPQMDIWYDHVYVDELLTYFQASERERVLQLIEKKGKRRTSLGAFDKLTAPVDGKRRFIDDPPFLIHAIEQAGVPVDEVIGEVFRSYRRSLAVDRRQLLDSFGFVDVARKVVGVGSVGMRVHLVLLQGRDEHDPLMLQVKQAGASVLERHTGRSTYRNHGQRVVQGQRLIQSASDIFLGWTSYMGIDFYVRQFRDMKIIPESATIAPVLAEFAAACGRVLARAHARSGDPVAIAGYIGKGTTFRDALVAFAPAYADQTERDHQQLVDAIKAGEVEAEPGW
jgi:uncharacterized protein (DUF2252 family)